MTHDTDVSAATNLDAFCKTSVRTGILGTIALSLSMQPVRAMDPATQQEERMTQKHPAPSEKTPKQCALPLSDAELRKRLTPQQYQVLRESKTEQPFANAYWNNKQPGLYVDVVTGEPLFASVDKFDSGTGWPSFFRPIRPETIVEKQEASHGMIRTEVRSKSSDSHLGHVFDDGPQPSGLRYCINSAALRFVPKDELEKEGYGQYRHLFESSPDSSP